MDLIDRQEVLPIKLVWDTPNLRAISRECFQALVPQLQLRHFYYPVSVQSVDDMYSQVLHLRAQADATTVVETHYVDDVDQDNTLRISGHVALFIASVCHNQSITTEPRCPECT
jgi:hypothetical protein